eukprot:TRINITY_DN32641_c0_g1_i1.p1 TRINITY_DN32641_c0_g1~~TRINITY_DN32641_c0_g1_i1.p1  ORF type:complete len:380 (+),score=100.44 TRINITY_DN32641_c0_g1_i1:46-1140(+)
MLIRSRQPCGTLALHVLGGGKFQQRRHESSEDKRRRIKAEQKAAEMYRTRNTERASDHVRAAVELKKSPPKKSALGVIKTIGFATWWDITWNGNRSRGGGLKNTLAGIMNLLFKIAVLVGPILYFFYDDGKSVYYTRLLVCKELRGVQSPHILDVGTGNGELARMMAFETRDMDGKILSIDLDTHTTEKAKRMLQSRGYTNVELEVRDVLDLPAVLQEKGRLAESSFSHTVMSMCLHEFDPKRRIAVLESAARVTQGGKIIVLDFTPSAYGLSNFSQFRNTFFEALSGHFTYFMEWSTAGGLEPLIEIMEEKRKEGTLDIPPMKVSHFNLEDRDTHACYVIDVGYCEPAQPPDGGTPSKRFFLF